ncbi:CPBP family intramembrane glutamic endopeptidase [Edaphobacter aggregans]|uniref:CPBP family intramembrane glutamic endopeptidase n=1 Tax=Edaphobacter aggregans TaxID=570835 RepID=UPI0005598BD0|nr:CPBP family intramembrane glutamic endopeptidase [Edaphobacter aggregans]
MSASDSTTTQARTKRTLQLALFGTSIAWALSTSLLSASSARGITNRFNVDAALPLLSSLFLLFLLTIGFSLLQTIARRPASARFVLGLPKRPTAGHEWLLGAAIGWGIVVLAVLPMALTGSLHTSFWTEPRAIRLIAVNLATLAAGSLAEEVIFRGYPFRCLIEAIGPVAATFGMSLLFGLARALQNGANRTGIFLAMLSGVVFSVAWLRTHGLWLAWGMRFAWTASMGILFGLPVAGSVDYSTLIQTTAVGRTWLTGGDYGPEAAAFMALALLLGLIVLVRTTRDYAWDYTHAAIVPGGYPMDIPPPAAHTAMEQAQQTRPPALIQILPTTPQSRSADTEPKL